MTAGPARGLSAKEQAAYRADGQVTPAFALAPGLLAEIREAAEALVAARADLRIAMRDAGLEEQMRSNCYESKEQVASN